MGKKIKKRDFARQVGPRCQLAIATGPKKKKFFSRKKYIWDSVVRLKRRKGKFLIFGFRIETDAAQLQNKEKRRRSDNWKKGFSRKVKKNKYS